MPSSRPLSRSHFVFYHKPDRDLHLLAERLSLRRVPEVIDTWFDSGSMPFAQWGYPHTPEGRAAFERAFPADFISEAIDQTRGWFYSLLAVSTLLFDQTSYRNVVCLGHIVDRDGRKMSKSLGNVLDPFELLVEVLPRHPNLPVT